jgi:hypothetical protein
MLSRNYYFARIHYFEQIDFAINFPDFRFSLDFSLTGGAIFDLVSFTRFKLSDITYRIIGLMLNFDFDLNFDVDWAI